MEHLYEVKLNKDTRQMADLCSILRANAEICCRYHHSRRLPPVGFLSRQIRHGLAIRQRLSPLSSLYLAV
jgi:hypothetical protein